MAQSRKKRKMDGYIRVSRRMGRDGPGYISPDVQREAIQRWADYKDVEIAAWHVDEDWSGGTHKRPGLEAAVERAVTGETGGIVSWKIDRFSRYTEGGLRDLRRLEDADARLAFVTEDIDTSGPMGKFVYTVMLAMSEYFLDNIKAGWVTAKTRAMDRGVKLGPTPVGYRRRDDATLDIDPDEGPVVAAAFEAAAERGLHAAVDVLTESRLTHSEGKRAGRARSWTTSTVRRLLTNRTYLGESRYGDRLDRAAHPPLVSSATWEAAQPEPPGRRKPKDDYPLSGLARCGSCGEAMVGGRGGPSIRTYRCRASLKLWKGDRCSAPATIVGHTLEEHVRGLLAEFLQKQWAAHDDLEGEVARAEIELREVEAELDSLVTDAGLRRSLGADRFRQLVETTVESVEAAQARYRDVAAKSARAFTVAEPDLVESATLEELGVLARGGLDAIVVQRGRGNVEARVELILKGAEADARMTTAQNS